MNPVNSTTTSSLASLNGHKFMDMSTASSATSNKLNYNSMLNLDNPVFCCFLLWTSVLVIKMLLMSLLTALQRFRFKIFANKEDLIFKNTEVQFHNPHVERVRRAHRNDMENILPYFTMSLIYICTNPSPSIACNLFRVAAIARIVHTLVYAFYPVPQPSRVFAWVIMYLITMYMAADILRQLPKALIKKIFPNQEDLFFKNIEVQFNDPHVERVRRAHRNDMENVLPYFTMALVYICTNPSPAIACNLFRLAAIARIVHTLVYAFYPVPQPSRVLAWVIMYLITLYMAADVGLQMIKYI